MASAVHLDENSALPISTATFNGRTIDLADGWDGATACLIPADAETECFATLAEAQAAAIVISQAEAAAAASGGTAQARAARLRSHGGPCQGNSGEWMWLYQNANWGGASLGVQSTDGWINLDAGGFGDETSSYSNDTGCTVYMAKSQDGSGSWLTAGAWASSSYVGNSWNDAINSVDISY